MQSDTLLLAGRSWFGKGLQYLPAATLFTASVSGCWWPASARSNMVISQGQAQQVGMDEQHPWHTAHIHYSLFLYTYRRHLLSPLEVIMTPSQLNDTLEGLQSLTCCIVALSVWLCWTFFLLWYTFPRGESASIRSEKQYTSQGHKSPGRKPPAC